MLALDIFLFGVVHLGKLRWLWALLVERVFREKVRVASMPEPVGHIRDHPKLDHQRQRERERGRERERESNSNNE